MSLSRFFCGMAGIIFAGANLLAADVKSSNTTVATPPVYIPSLTHATGPLPDGILSWDATTKQTNVTADAAVANFIFNFSNVSTQSRRYFKCPSVMRVHHRQTAAVALDPRARHQWSDGGNGESRRQKRYVV